MFSLILNLSEFSFNFDVRTCVFDNYTIKLCQYLASIYVKITPS